VEANKSIDKHQAEMARFYNFKCRDPPRFQVSERVWLDSANLYPGFSRNKLDPRLVGLFVVVDVP
jgi:hypothetical protein